ncbi:hypothetical protein KI688_012113 [Linnemannia hyalina]|uniref:Uncharacterized protein n=1 Tax=Linnemannia hyalina TaxID=64524 RepID=A0A9P8BT70_9FUNG|nr:hypothetical protein KI688_012113 [Linnemannia hyalina]
MPIVLHGPNLPVYDTPDRKPHGNIIGAGIAAGISYDVFEKSPKAKIFGGALFPRPKRWGPLFAQMGIMDEYLVKSKQC